MLYHININIMLYYIILYYIILLYIIIYIYAKLDIMGCIHIYIYIYTYIYIYRERERETLMEYNGVCIYINIL